MKPEDQVCSLELAKKLKELGVKQESIFYWDEHNDLLCPEYYDEYSTKILCSAFTSSELGNILPAFIQTEVGGSSSHDGKYYLQTFKGRDDEWGLGYVLHESLPPLISILYCNEADSRAQALIWLIENGYVKV